MAGTYSGLFTAVQVMVASADTAAPVQLDVEFVIVATCTVDVHALLVVSESYASQ